LKSSIKHYRRPRKKSSLACYRIIRGVVRKRFPKASEDVIQEVFCSYLQSDKSFLSPKWITWRALNVLEKEKKHRHFPLTEEESSPRGVSLEEKEWLYKGISSLPFAERRIIFLSFWKDLSDTEIASLLGARKETVRELRKRALERLRSG